MKMKLWHNVLLGMLLGILCGYFFKDYYHLFKPLATVYINLVKMIVVPTIFFAVIYGITNISDVGTIGRIGLKSSIVYIIATVIAVAIGMLAANYLQPGISIDLLTGTADTVHGTASSVITLEKIFVDIFPSNPIAAMAEGKTLQVVCFAIIFGLSLILAGEKAAEARKIFASVTSAVFKMVELVIKITPYGAFAIMAWIVGEHGFSLICSLGKLAYTIMGAFAVQYLLFGLALLLFRLNPIKFYKKTSNIQSIAFATSSSKATIIPAIRELQEKMGVSKKIASFVLPMGATINMTGSAIYIAICALFFAQVYGISLTYHQYLILAITSTIGSIGAAGYPSGAVIMLSMVLPTIGLPIDHIPLIMGIDRLLDMFRTVINVTGDCTATVIIDKMNGTLDLEKYSD
jgi:Na+/H+-dicarboxylate symporter